MEVVAATPNGNGVPPFHNHDVREWSRIDSLTGVLERARLETDHWTASTSNSSHKYGKVVDSRARSDADGAVQQRARRQLEVFQSSVPGGRLQVIKSHTVSSSRWTSKSPTVGDHKDIAQHFGDLELSLNPLDLSSQKSKATVGRSVGRRPPSRPRGRDETSSIGRQGIPSTNVHATAAVNLHRVSRLCHQIHENAVKQTFGKYLHKPPIHERESGDGVEIVEVESVNSSDNEKPKPVNGHASLTRTKSTSSEDLHLLTPEKDKPNKSIEDLEDLEQLQNWRRSSKIRRSLQFPKQNKAAAVVKPHDLPENTGSVRKIREDLETGRRLSTALRGNNVDLEALDQILQSISSSSGSDKNSTNSDKYEQPEKEAQISVKKQKRNSFVTVESLQEVRGRLRRTSSPTEDIYQIKSDKNDPAQRSKKEEETDDGIVTEENNLSSKQFDEMPVSDSLITQSRVRSYVYGMEAIINKKPGLGTGSLESRTSKQINGTSGYRSEDWYNRRKSYGFEQVHNHQEPMNSISKNKGLMESSTDSGICRSSEIVLVPTANKSSVQLNKSSDYNSEIDSEKEDKYVFNKNNKYENQNGSVVLNVGSVRRYTSIFEQKKENSPVPSRKAQDLNSMWNHQDERIDRRSPRKEFEGTTITIPIVSQNPSESFNRRQFDDTNRFSDENHWTNTYNQNNQNGEIKRHSIAVDESKYVTRASDNKFRRTSLAVNDKVTNNINDQFLQDGLEDDISQGKKQKKVEFCKTEVHFAADSGRVNIVATDEKPPPTNNFRRRRRNSAAMYNQLLNDMNKNGLPVLHFGDSSYEKNLFGITDHEDDSFNANDFRSDPNSFYDNKQNENDVVTASTVTVSTNQSYHNYQHETEDDQKENLENETPKGILKNKPIKPKPYLLGDDNFFKQGSDNEENGIWGVKLKPVNNKSETPMWRSTVTLKNTLYDRQQDEEYSSMDNSLRDTNYAENKRVPENSTQPEFQKLLRSLRPTRKDLDDNQRSSENYDGIRIMPPQPDPRRSSWSVADMVKQVEDVQKSEVRGYSTKVNIGGGEATVIEDNAQEEKGRHPTWPRHDDNLKGFPNLHVSQNSSQTELDEVPTSNNNFLSESTRTWEKQQKQTKSINSRTPHSPVVLRKAYNDSKKQELRTAYNSDNLASPFLVGQNNVSRNEYEPERPRRTTELSSSLRRKKEKHAEEKITKVYQNSNSRLRERRSPTPTKEAYQNYSPSRQKDKRSPSPVKRISPTYSPVRQKEKHSPSPPKDAGRHYSPSRPKEKRAQVSTSEDTSHHKSSTSGRQKSPSRSVLRNPRKSEMAYFGVKTSPSPKPARKPIGSSDRKSWDNKPDLLQHYDSKETVKYRKESNIETTKHQKASPERREKERPESPIYENIDEIKRYTNKTKSGKKEFDSSILDELTKAADQILQAVNGYAEDAQKHNEEEENNQRGYRREKLDTISETKSWKQETSSRHKSSSHRSESAKPKLKHTSSTSSVESVAEQRKSMTPVRRTATDTEKHKKKTNGDANSSRAATKARRLQRASSREALLQSHGSSSEDLPVTIEVPVRKPRLVRKTKATQLTVTNVVEVSKSSASKKREEKGKSEERIPVGALPEIRHKTAVSTIRSTAEKSASRDRVHRSRTEEIKKKSSSKKETSRISSTSKSDRNRSISSKDPINHRISTANIKKCNKSEGSTRQ